MLRIVLNIILFVSINLVLKTIGITIVNSQWWLIMLLVCIYGIVQIVFD